MSSSSSAPATSSTSLAIEPRGPKVGFSGRMRGILQLPNLQSKLSSQSNRGSRNGDENVWKSNLTSILGAMNLVHFNRWSETNRATAAPTDSWSDTRLLSVLIENFNVRTVNLYHYCVERKLPMDEQALRNMLVSELSKPSQTKRLPEEKLKYIEDILDYMFCLRREMRQLSRDIEVRIRSIPDSDTSTGQVGRLTLRRRLCAMWDPCPDATHLQTSNPYRPLPWTVSPTRITAYLNDRSNRIALEATTTTTTKPKPASAAMAVEHEQPLLVKDKTNEQTFVLQVRNYETRVYFLQFLMYVCVFRPHFGRGNTYGYLCFPRPPLHVN